MSIQAIVTDIEGTTSSLSFVKDVLFPYARQHLAAFVKVQAENPEVRAILNAVAAEIGQAELSDADAITQLLNWMAEDRKITPLKALQGLIWQNGYQRGDFTGHVYADAEKNLRSWQAQGIRLYVYSSGSEYAQKLLFGYSDFGDLTGLFSGYFDTRIGAKQSSVSYQHIVAALGLPAESILFLSDIVAELDAAQSAGLKTTHLVRDGALPSNPQHPIARHFDEVAL